jgi:hypothetical protein
MPTEHKLSPRQHRLIDDLFDASLDTSQALAKNNVNAKLYHKWLADERFAAEFDRKIDWLNRHSDALIAKFTSLAAARLIELVNSEKDEIARKACIDILTMPRPNDKASQANSDSQTIDAAPDISDSQASAILNILAGKDNSP